ncbi:hypothetical protein SLEP1_g3000 [Rubroshorea leprosula]|uniref:Uncharacterized protein n=1 Tax=Rubroshorea leprosula TaxID=152421 RepID=A0AAV5HUE0_9ROSI|nr:hypothetical protein SLEP1_g3000 [Rubroshorea leprosula]
MLHCIPCFYDCHHFCMCSSADRGKEKVGSSAGQQNTGN